MPWPQARGRLARASGASTAVIFTLAEIDGARLESFGLYCEQSDMWGREESLVARLLS